MQMPIGGMLYRVAIPNKEVGLVYRTEVLASVRDVLPEAQVGLVQRAVVTGDSAGLESALGDLLERVVSVRDPASEGFLPRVRPGIGRHARRDGLQGALEPGERSRVLRCRARADVLPPARRRHGVQGGWRWAPRGWRAGPSWIGASSLGGHSSDECVIFKNCWSFDQRMRALGRLSAVIGMRRSGGQPNRTLSTRYFTRGVWNGRLHDAWGSMHSLAFWPAFFQKHAFGSEMTGAASRNTRSA